MSCPCNTRSVQPCTCRFGRLSIMSLARRRHTRPCAKTAEHAVRLNAAMGKPVSTAEHSASGCLLLSSFSESYSLLNFCTAAQPHPDFFH